LPPSDKQRAEAILRWVVFARRPLTILELSEVVTVLDTSENEEPQFDDLPDSCDEEFVDDEILGICGSFLELRATTPDEELRGKTVHLIHFSATEFLLGPHEYAPFADNMLQEYHLAQKCLRYIDCSVTWQPEFDEDPDNELIQDRPFLVYASFCWFQHVSACAHSPYDMNPRLLSFFSAANPNWSEWRSYYEDSEDEDSEGLGSEEIESEEDSDTDKSNPEVSEAEENESDGDVEDDNLLEEDPEEESTGEGDTEDRKTGSVYSEAGPIPGGRTYYAALFGLEDVLKYLHENDMFDKDQSGGELGNPLQAAAFRGQTGALKFLLDVGANPEAEGQFGSALHAAVAGNQERAVAILLCHGASVSSINSIGKTPLARSIDVGNYTITQQLLENNSDSSIADIHGDTPLMAAAFGGHLEVVRLLVKNGASITAKDNKHATPLHWAARNGHAHILKFLLNHGADLSLRDIEGSTPLVDAAPEGHLEVIKVLLDHGAEINVINNYGQTPLTYAAWAGHQTVIKLLLHYGADPAVTGDKDGWNALIWAACKGHSEIVRTLLDVGADPNSRTSKGRSALSVAARDGHLDIVKDLLDRGASSATYDSSGWTPLLAAASNGHCEVVKALLTSGANLEACSLDGFSPLFTSALEGHQEVVKALLDSGASPETPDSMGRTPLTAAAFYGYPEIARTLLNFGADALALTSRRRAHATPIHYASERGHVNVVQLLLDAGVDINIPASDGSTPLHYAVQCNHLAVIELLIQSNAQLSHQDLFGRTPFQYAAKATIDALREQFPKCEEYAHPTEGVIQQQIRNSIQALSGTPISLEEKDLVLLDTLGRCLLKSRDLSAATKVFDETLRLDEESGKIVHDDIICDQHHGVILGERWVCTSCRFNNLCAACMAKFPDGAERSFCSGHEYFCIPASDWDASRQTDVYTEEFVSWLKELQVQYGVASL
jgi:ankyrin repeat protein